MEPNLSNKRTLRRRVLTHVLGVALVGACVFTALQIREFFLLRSVDSPPRGSATGSLSASDSASRDDWAGNVASSASAPADLLSFRDAAERAGALERYVGDPAGIAPPPGASALDGWQQRAYGATRQLRTYRCTQSLDDVAAHYRQQASDKGLTLMDQQPGEGTRHLQWTAPGLHVMVSLRQEGAGQVRATVTASRAEK